jgi:hypothetical protein
VEDEGAMGIGHGRLVGSLSYCRIMRGEPRRFGSLE